MGCSSLTSIEFKENFITSNVTNMENMFNNCQKITNLNLNNDKKMDDNNNKIDFIIFIFLTLFSSEKTFYVSKNSMLDLFSLLNKLLLVGKNERD